MLKGDGFVFLTKQEYVFNVLMLNAALNSMAEISGTPVEQIFNYIREMTSEQYQQLTVEQIEQIIAVNEEKRE
ncbi:hypothetical protein NIES2109_30270 [Nostoc sp. HK-01]|uniref:Uncharacterized protein n=2 Tax=Nostocales TaxID=1161 RepID=A0A1Z4GDR8_9CYAN|nr:hypothetical protein [Nostoc cycadae]BAY15664.1 hypothetical protein NIES21_14830 [Anabaenopsis circularis NIES-21]BBD60232.1 hypothetical protein NIES2109_30270 [Nostoc sp. HK-01]GBE94405.1 hypothetical protein NCWK1_4181 [Nostoc cycadae WK-1]